MPATTKTKTPPPPPKPKPIERLKRKFADAGLEPADLVPALVVHEMLALAMALGFWGTCYALEPSKVAASGVFSRGGKMKVQPPRALAALYERSLSTARATLNNGNRSISSRIPILAKADPARATVSLAESLCLRAALKPATFVFKIWASAAVVVRGKRALAARAARARRGQGREMNDKKRM